jgi:hypothetical protein
MKSSVDIIKKKESFNNNIIDIENKKVYFKGLI